MTLGVRGCLCISLLISHLEFSLTFFAVSLAFFARTPSVLKHTRRCSLHERVHCSSFILPASNAHVSFLLASISLLILSGVSLSAFCAHRSLIRYGEMYRMSVGADMGPSSSLVISMHISHYRRKLFRWLNSTRSEGGASNLDNLAISSMRFIVFATVTETHLRGEERERGAVRCISLRRG